MRFVLSLTLMLLGHVCVANASSINIAFGTAVCGEPAPTGAAVLGQAGDQWNQVNSGGSGTYGNLVDTRGNNTGALVTFTASGVWDDCVNGVQVPPLPDLMNKYIYGYPPSGITVTLSGLAPNTPFSLVLYVSSNDASGGDRSLSGTVNGVPFLATGNPELSFVNGQNTVLLNGITDSSGDVNILASHPGGGSEVDMNGLQIVQNLLQSGSSCDGTYNGNFNGNLTVMNGQACILVGSSVTGNITLNGGSLAISYSAIGGNVQVQGGGIFSIGPSTAIGGNLQIQNIPVGTGQSQICGTTVRGDLQIQNDAAPVLIGAAAPASCAGNQVGGNLTIQSNTATVSAVGNTVSNNLTVQNNSAATTINGNFVTGNLQDQNNTAATTINGNIVTGNLQDQNNTAGTEVFGNIVGNNLQCQQNSPITGGGNAAGQKQGQCTAF